MGYPAPGYRGGSPSRPGGSQSPGRGTPYYGRPGRSPARIPIPPRVPPGIARFALGRLLGPLGLLLLAYELWQYFGKHHGFHLKYGPCASNYPISVYGNGNTLACFTAPIGAIPDNATGYNAGMPYPGVPGIMVVQESYERDPVYTGSPKPNGASVPNPLPLEDPHRQPHVPDPDVVPPPYVQPLVPEGLPIFQPWVAPQTLPRWIVPFKPDFNPFGDPIRGPSPTRRTSPDPTEVPETAPDYDPRTNPVPWFPPLAPWVPPLATVKPWEVPDLTITEDGVLRTSPNGHKKQPPKATDKETKVRSSGFGLLGALSRTVNAPTEARDLLDAIWSALPKNKRSKGKWRPKSPKRPWAGRGKPLPDKMLKDLAKNWKHLDVPKALENVKNEMVNDMVFGTLGRGVGKQFGKVSRRPFGAGTGPAL